MKIRTAVILGTRPEGIKLAPVIDECRRRNEQIDLCVINTGQHRELLDPILDFFSVRADCTLSTMTSGGSLAQMTSYLISEIDRSLREIRPDVVIVQGDTTTALAGALISYYLGAKVVHVEAGLRTDHLRSPFPEEVNRRMISQMASLHCAPTVHAKERLQSERLPEESRILVTGNTVIDALYRAVPIVKAARLTDDDLEVVRRWNESGIGKRMILITGHRRESFGGPFEEVCEAIREISLRYPEVLMVFPVHLNPSIQGTVAKMLSGIPNVRLTGPKNYPAFVALMLEAALIITDSGGIQEEAPALGKRVVVTRAVTERSEAVQTGLVRIAGTSRLKIISEVHEALRTNNDTSNHFVRSPYGDGKAAERIVGAMIGEKISEFDPHAAG